MPLSTRTQKLVWGTFAARCAVCHEIVLHTSASGNQSLLGEICHIVGEQSDAARGNSSMKMEERNHFDNLMLLCRKHHKIIDDDEETYTIEKLKEIRTTYLDWLREILDSASPWKIQISAFAYLNIPRLREFATLNGFTLRTSTADGDSSLGELGYGLNDVMASCRATLENVPLVSVPVAEISFVHEDYIGQLINFDRLRFRTKNLPVNRPNGVTFRLAGDLRTDPHIYCKFTTWTLIIRIEPRWITTTTAYGMFRPTSGTSTFTGFARVTEVNYESMTMIASGLAIGVPLSRVNLDGGGSPKNQGECMDLSLAEDDVTKSRGDYWIGQVTSCDFCGRSFSEEQYMIDGPLVSDGSWGNMCGTCYCKNRLPFGIGKGQLYRHDGKGWLLVAGYPRSLEQDQA